MMGAFPKWYGRAARPGVERLEDRLAPSVSNPAGGPILPNVEVATVYYGQAWAGATAQEQQLDGFFRDITTSAFMDMLAEYGAGWGAFVGNDVKADATSPAARTTLTDARIQSMLAAEIQAGAVPAPTADRLYVVFAPPNVTVRSPDGSSRIDLEGYHGAFRTAAGQPVFYAVIPDPVGNVAGSDPSLAGLTEVQKQTVVASHELAEAVTDPGAGSGVVADGWFDATPSSPTYGDEIGDMTSAYGFVQGYAVQDLWSNRANANARAAQPAGWSPLGQAAAAVVTATDADGRLELFAVAPDHTLAHAAQVSPGGPWSAWSSLDGIVEQVAVGSNSDGRLEVFAVGSDNTLYTTVQAAAGSAAWTGWVGLGGVVGQIAVGQDADGRLAVFAVGSDAAVYDLAQAVPNGGWTPWVGLGGVVGQIAVNRDALGRLEVFATGADHSLYTIAQAAAGSAAWSGWSGLGGVVEQIAAGRDGAGRLAVFAVGSDNGLYTIGQATPGGAWGGWAGLGGDIQQVGVSTNADGRLEVFAVGGDATVWHQWQTVPAGPWSGWYYLGGKANQLGAGLSAEGRLGVFVVGLDGALYHADQLGPGTSWGYR
jgi:hypothetical protein